MNLNDVKFEVSIQNFDELKELLQKAADQVKQLDTTLNQIKKFELKVNVKNGLKA